MLLGASLANLGVFCCFFGWFFDVYDIYKSLTGEVLNGALPVYIYMESVFKFIRAVCYYSGEVTFILQYYVVNMRIKGLTNKGSNTLTES